MELPLVLIIVLIAVIIWRGPKTLPQLGRAFGQGVKEARKEIDGMKSDMSGDQAATTGPAAPPPAPAAPAPPPPAPPASPVATAAPVAAAAPAAPVQPPAAPPTSAPEA